MKERVVLSWSGGKDSALALREIQRLADYDVVALLTTITEGTDCVGMHCVRRELLVRQAEAVGIPLRELRIPPFPPNDVYEARLRSVLEEYAAEGVRTVGFGDLFLEDIRSYREEMLSRLGMRGLYPIWQRDTGELAREFVAAGFGAILVCVDLRKLDRSFAGRLLDRQFLEDLPPEVDPCGENGEFHTFVFDGPGFRGSIAWRRGAVREESTFAYCDLLPGSWRRAANRFADRQLDRDRLRPRLRRRSRRTLARMRPSAVGPLEILAEILHPEGFDFGHRGVGWETAR